jgi:hypothetical protein
MEKVTKAGIYKHSNYYSIKKEIIIYLQRFYFDSTFSEALALPKS